MVFIYCKLSCNQKWCLKKKLTNLVFSVFTFLPFQTLKTFNPPSFPSPSPPHSVCPFSERQMAFLIDKIEFPCLMKGKTSTRDKKDPKSFINYVERTIPDFICGCIFLRTHSPVFLILLYLLKLLCGLSSHHEDKGSSRYLTSMCWVQAGMQDEPVPYKIR